MSKSKIYQAVAFIGCPLIIFFYFLKWKNGSIHDDDLFVFRTFSATKGFWAKVNMAAPSGILRPLQGLSIYILIQTFYKNFFLYFAINVAYQAINTLLFARILNLFLKSPYVSLLISLILGLSRYCYYNIVQLYGGAALEGLATMFFLLCLYFLLRVLVNDQFTEKQKQKGLLYSILFANLCMYTHERYLVLFPFIILVVLFFPSLKSIHIRTRAFLASLAASSVVLPLLIKKYVFATQLFMGTGYTSISFSFASITAFFFNTILSLFQINLGPEYLSGIPYSSLSELEKIMVIILVAGMLLILFRYMIKVFQEFKVRRIAFIRITDSKARKAFLKGNTFQNRFFIFFFLLLLFGLLLAPAVVQIRVELRWLQAPLILVILMTVIAISGLRINNTRLTNGILIIFAALFLWTDAAYLNKGAKNLYFSTAGRIGATFDKAIKEGVIRKNNSILYVWEKHRNPDREGEINWALAGGYFFNLYQDKNTQMVYVDSLYQKKDSGYVYSFPSFNKDSAQIISLDIANDDQTFKYTITDITNQYLKDSLKNLKQ